ncbi:MAG: formylglycine-generating enzyme family protein [Spirulinaceae cyanobacterium]
MSNNNSDSFLTHHFETVTLNRKGEISQKTSHQIQYFQEDLGDGITLDMVYIPGGTLMMGSPPNEKDSTDYEHPQHQVTLQPFFIIPTPMKPPEDESTGNQRQK